MGTSRGCPGALGAPSTGRSKGTADMYRKKFLVGFAELEFAGISQ